MIAALDRLALLVFGERGVCQGSRLLVKSQAAKTTNANAKVHPF
jgi:hypothetical protein